MAADPCSWPTPASLHGSYLNKADARPQRSTSTNLRLATAPGGQPGAGIVTAPSTVVRPSTWGAVEKLGAIVELVQISYPDYSNRPKKVSTTPT
jgi:hypothetical protein